MNLLFDAIRADYDWGSVFVLVVVLVTAGLQVSLDFHRHRSLWINDSTKMDASTLLLAGLQVGLDFHSFTSFKDLNETIPTTPT